MSQCNYCRQEYTLLRKAFWCLNDHSMSSESVNTLPTVYTLLHRLNTVACQQLLQYVENSINLEVF